MFCENKQETMQVYCTPVRFSNKTREGSGKNSKFSWVL